MLTSPKRFACAFGASVMLMAMNFGSANESPQAVTAADYARAERFLRGHMPQYVDNADIEHHWIGSEDKFWYLRANAAGEHEFVVVDAATGEKSAAFDQKIIAAGLTEATKNPVNALKLPFSVFRFVSEKQAIEFRIGTDHWTCQINSPQCFKEAPSGEHPFEVVSPDGRWAAFVRDYNVWIRPTGGGEEIELTKDGVEHNSYATFSGYGLIWMALVRHGLPLPTQVLWSPDSKRLLTYRMDDRKVKNLSLLQSVPEDGSIRPKLYTFRYPMPGDEDLPLGQLVVLDVTTRQQTSLAAPQFIALFASPMQKHDAWWAADGKSVYYIRYDRYRKNATLYKVDAGTGGATELFNETSRTFLELTPEYFEQDLPTTLANGEVVWYSQRDGWGHLYLYDAAGKLLNQITHGEWNVRSIAHIDEAHKRIYFLAGGREKDRDPAEVVLYGVGLDGKDLRMLTPEEGDHELPHGLGLLKLPDAMVSDTERLRFSPSGRYFVDTYSRPNTAPVFVVRTAAGKLIKKLEEADLTRLKAGGYMPVEPFKVMAADGKTPIYGNLYRPSNFDPSKRYPIIDSIYPGPMDTRVGKNFGQALFGTFDAFQTQSLAELGFIVVTIDGRGTALRSKAFMDYAYGHMERASDLEDHIAGMRQLARRYPYMDLDRVGAEGLSGGGYATAHALLAYPDFYKVGVASSGNQDQRGYISAWGEMYLGPLRENEKAYLAAANTTLAGNLKGKLLLIHGEMDENVSPTLTLKLVDALIKANKDFDLLYMPNEGHGAALSPYAMRREWDYFVRNLLGAEPPADYDLRHLH
ncbi:MAG TPA: DPP IV N-terminal domain-containing protein [Bradyrhizobium sp.]